MGDDDDTIIERLKGVVHTSTLDEQLANVHLSRMELARVEGIIGFPPVSQMELARAEGTIGFPLPALLRRIYLEVGNGGFGPGVGLFPLNDEEDPHALDNDTLVTTYVLMHPTTPEQIDAYMQGDNPPPFLPEEFLMVCDQGCSMYSWLDCSRPELPNLHPLEKQFFYFVVCVIGPDGCYACVAASLAYRVRPFSSQKDRSARQLTDIQAL